MRKKSKKYLILIILERNEIYAKKIKPKKEEIQRDKK
jgi:hypothetical protein